jgi:hypothetical protein
VSLGVNNNDLRALLCDALAALRVLASYLDSDYSWPNAGLRADARDVLDRMVKRIEAALGAEPGEEVTLREENPDLGETLLGQMKADVRKAKYDELWSQAILDGCSRAEAHRRAYAGSRDK